MCDVCNSETCVSRCPNHEDIVIGCCAECGEEIYSNSFYFHNDEYMFCDEYCVFDFYDIKESL